MKKVILITGTSTGLGLKTAVLLAEKGHQVYATMRDLNKKQALENELQASSVKAVIKALDVSIPESIDKVVKEIIKLEGKIDVLINNAGAGFLRASELATDQEIQQVTDVNYFGVVRMTNAVLPYMRAAKSGHIINISSVGGLVGQPFNELYCAAKFAVEGYTEALASYMTPSFGINFTILEPGGISTEFSNTVLKEVMTTQHTKHPEYESVFQKYMASFQNRSAEEKARIYQTPDQVAQVIQHCIDSKRPPLRLRTSDWSNEFCHFKTAADPDGLKLHDHLVKNYFAK